MLKVQHHSGVDDVQSSVQKKPPQASLKVRDATGSITIKVWDIDTGNLAWLLDTPSPSEVVLRKNAVYVNSFL